jgi:hypothetical protein
MTTASFLSIWPQLGIAMVLGVIFLSYAIEKRSPDLTNRTGVPRFAMVFHTIFNISVARDRQTQLMRALMLALLAGIVVLFIIVAVVVSGIERPPGG